MTDPPINSVRQKGLPQMEMKEHLIQQVPLFSKLPDYEIRQLAAQLKEYNVNKGEILFNEDEIGDQLYIILDGELEVIKALGGMDEHHLAVRQAGEFVGEMSLLQPEGKRTASVRARTDAYLLEMSRADFDALLGRQPSLTYDLARILSAHLQAANVATIRDLQQKNLELAVAYQALKAAQAQIVEKEVLERELQVARQIQESIVPRHMPHLAGFAFSGTMVPARAVGGDLFDLIQLDEDTLGIAIGDVSGKGVPAALFMALTCSLLRQEARRHESPVDVLRAVNQYLLEMNDAGMFVTLLYGVLHGASHEFTYARAGHEIPLVVTPSGDLINAPRSLGHPLAFIPDPALDEQVLRLPKGSTMLLYTDGVTDATTMSGEFFGLDQLKHTLQRVRAVEPEQVCDQLLEQLMHHADGASQADDITLVAIQASS